MTATETTLKASDLRIGNWIYSNSFKDIGLNLPFKVEVTDFEKIHFNDDSEQYSPIPLTPEILEKAGWHKRDVAGMEDDYKCYFFQTDEIEFGWNSGNNEVDMFYDDASASLPIRHIKHLHELQNFIYSITGSELEINL